MSTDTNVISSETSISEPIPEISRPSSFDSLKDEDKKSRAQEKLNQVLEIYKEENGLNAKKEVMRKNDASLDEELKSINLYNDDNSISEDFADLKELVANIEVKDDENNEV